MCLPLFSQHSFQLFYICPMETAKVFFSLRLSLQTSRATLFPFYLNAPIQLLKWRRERDSNPRDPKTGHGLSCRFSRLTLRFCERIRALLWTLCCPLCHPGVLTYRLCFILELYFRLLEVALPNYLNLGCNRFGYKVSYGYGVEGQRRVKHAYKR